MKNFLINKEAAIKAGVVLGTGAVLMASNTLVARAAITLPNELKDLLGSVTGALLTYGKYLAFIVLAYLIVRLIFSRNEEKMPAIRKEIVVVLVALILLFLLPVLYNWLVNILTGYGGGGDAPIPFLQ